MEDYVGEYEDNYYADFSTTSDLRSLSKEVFKDKYKKRKYHRIKVIVRRFARF